jgi:hypothetical protein
MSCYKGVQIHGLTVTHTGTKWKVSSNFMAWPALPFREELLQIQDIHTSVVTTLEIQLAISMHTVILIHCNYINYYKMPKHLKHKYKFLQ